MQVVDEIGEKALTNPPRVCFLDAAPCVGWFVGNSAFSLFGTLMAVTLFSEGS